MLEIRHNIPMRDLTFPLQFHLHANNRNILCSKCSSLKKQHASPKTTSSHDMQKEASPFMESDGLLVSNASSASGRLKLQLLKFYANNSIGNTRVYNIPRGEHSTILHFAASNSYVDAFCRRIWRFIENLRVATNCQCFRSSDLLKVSDCMRRSASDAVYKVPYCAAYGRGSEFG